MMLRFGETKVTKEKFYAAKKLTKIWDVNVDNVLISNLVKAKTKYLVRYFDEAIKPLVLVMCKISGYVKSFKVKDEDKDTAIKFILTFVA